MKKILLLQLAVIFVGSSFAQRGVEWISTTRDKTWVTEKGLTASVSKDKFDAEIRLDQPLQTIDGFGTCFNELGWTSLSILPAKDRESIFKELFAPGVGANFTICRMPVGANDFSRRWYSYDETDGDFEMKDFSIANDLETLVPFIKNAQKYNPSLKLWASPWSPPSWMKYNKHYAARSLLGNSSFKSEEWGMDLTGINNGLPPEKEGREGMDMLIQEDNYFKAYTLYFAKFVQAYRQQNIKIAMVMPQNEFNSAQVFPSCTWTAAGLSKFINYLGPQMQHEKTSVFFGTVERANEKLVDTILNAPSGKYIKGVGFQWAGKGAIPAIHKQYPGLTLYQSEQECGNGNNDWKYCTYAWGLMKHYLTNGANAYMYWNTSLKQGSISTWGWKQNSLVLVDTVHKTYRYNYEYYLMKHVSHFVKPGAKRLETSGDFTNLLAFRNTNGSIVIVAQNDSDTEKKVKIKVGKKLIEPTLKAASLNSFVLKN
jgi:glucosylceramidase